VELGASQVTGPSLYARATVQHPVGWNRLSPYIEPVPAAFLVTNRLGTREYSLSRLQPRGSRACLPTHHRSRYRVSAQGGLPACWAPRWRGRTCTYWTTNRISWKHRLLQFHRTSMAWPLLVKYWFY